MAAPGPELLIAGGGPAGMMAGLLFARAGVETLVLEKHDDFLRDFRGDTVHPSTLRLFHELGMLEEFLKRPHDKVGTIGAIIGATPVEIADFGRLDPRWNFIVMMPQWEFLDFVAAQASLFGNFSLRMGAQATGLIEENGKVVGVACRDGELETTIRARLVIAADGRGSQLRRQSGLPLRTIGAPMDVLWFKIPKLRGEENDTTGIFASGTILAMIDRGDYWQCAFVIPKGNADATRSRGLAAFRATVASAAAALDPDVTAITSWDDVKLLTVALDRLDRWHRPGLLVIGDAAHAMSPIGGVGINVAIQDAVAAANILAAPLARGEDVDPLLGKIQARRMLPVRIIQRFQAAAQRRIIAPWLRREGAATVKPALPIRLLGRFRPLRYLPAALVGIGFRAEHVRSPAADPEVD